MSRLMHLMAMLIIVSGAAVPVDPQSSLISVALVADLAFEVFRRISCPGDLLLRVRSSPVVI